MCDKKKRDKEIQRLIKLGFVSTENMSRTILSSHYTLYTIQKVENIEI